MKHDRRRYDLDQLLLSAYATPAEVQVPMGICERRSSDHGHNLTLFLASRKRLVHVLSIRTSVHVKHVGTCAELRSLSNLLLDTYREIVDVVTQTF